MPITRSGFFCVLALITACKSPAPPPEAAVQALTRSLQATDGVALWQALPPSMKAQLAGVVRRFGQTVDPDVSAALQQLVVEAGQALAGQTQRLDRIEAVREKVAADQDRQLFAESLVAMLEVGGAKHLFGSAARPEEDLERAGPALLRLLVVILRASESPLLTSWPPGPYQLQPLADGRMTARPLDTAGATPEILVQVDGRWLPERWLSAWHEVAQRADRWLDGGPRSALASHHEQIVRLLNQTRARLPKVKAAADQDSFDRAVKATTGTLGLAIVWAITPEPPGT
jgi:hypothetical protein